MLETHGTDQLDEVFRSLPPSQVQVPEDLRDVFEKRGPVATSYDERRRFGRFHFGTRAVLEFSAAEKLVPREDARHRIYTRDLSRGGAAFLHSEQLFPGEKVVLWLQAGRMRAVVMHCLRKGPHCYLVGVSFGETVSEDQFTHLHGC